MIDIVNLQRKIKLDTDGFRKFIVEIGNSVSESQNRTLSVAFVSNNRMKQLNEMFRGKNSTTDVLSFPYEPDVFQSESPAAAGGFAPHIDSVQPPTTVGGSDFLGDIVISAEQAAKQATENKLSLDTEIKQLILHGLLHLCGYDHETDNGEMNARELELRDLLKI